MNTLTDDRGLRHDVLKEWAGAHVIWYRTGCGLTLPDVDIYTARYEDAYCERCIERKGWRDRSNSANNFTIDDVSRWMDEGRIP